MEQSHSVSIFIIYFPIKNIYLPNLGISSLSKF